MKIIFAFILCALLATALGFRIRQPNGATDIANGLTTLADEALEDTELGIDQTVEDTQALTDCVAACTNPMQFIACSTNCWTQFTTTAANQLAQDTQIVMGQATGGATTAA
jgi:hypothetical protein